MKYRFLTEADQELDDAISQYDRARPQLGAEFASAVALALEKVLGGPERWTIIDNENGPVRRCMTDRFPYALLYRVEDDMVEVIAVMHMHRNPGYWRGRGRP